MDPSSYAAIKDLGFPAVMSLALLWVVTRELRSLRRSFDRMTTAFQRAHPKLELSPVEDSEGNEHR